MKRSKIILQSDKFYYFLIFIVVLLYLINTYFPHKTTYKEFNNKYFIVTKLDKKDYGLKLELKGKEKVLGYLYKNDIKLLPGDKIIVDGIKKEINNNTIPNTFNYKKYLISNKVYNVIEITKIKKVKSNNNKVYKIKNKLLYKANRIEKSKSYINSLIFGNNGYIDEDTLESYRNNGISHLFAISGLHIAMFLFILSKLLNLLRISYNKKNIIYILFLIYFLFITNFVISAVRASIFTILLIINKSLELNIKTRNILFLTLFIICIYNPLALNNIGLQYSFIVTLTLILVNNNIKGKYIKKVFFISYISFFASLPITIYNFYEVNIMAIIYNVIFVPLMSFIIIPMSLLTFLFPLLDSILYFLIKSIESLSHLFEALNIGKINCCKMPCLIYMSYYVIFFIIVCKTKKIKRYLLFLSILLFIISNIWKMTYHNQIIVFDVKQGDSVLVMLNSKAILIDTGGKPMYNDSKLTSLFTRNDTIPYLKSIGVCKLDVLLLTHGDFDHMGEAKYLVSNFTVKRVIFNVGEFNTLEKDLIKVLEEKNVKYYRIINELKVDDIKIYFLNTKIYDNENDNSNVIYFELNNKKFLFMGDAGESKEQDILYKYNIKNVDVLKVGHHGSDTSSSKEFIDEINPKYSVISVGKNNRYGHPNKEVLDNLKESKVYRTDEDGSIMFKIKNNKLKIETCSP